MSRRSAAIAQGARLGLIYFAIVFTAGVALGVLRVLVVAPSLGDTVAVLLELPVILTLSWLVCRRLTRHLLDGLVERSAMSACALILVLTVEFGLALLATGAQPIDALHRWTTPSGALGLLGQVMFALLPLISETPSRAAR